MASGPRCETCGAPDDGTRVMCAFCGQAVSAEAQRTAVGCPACRAPNRAGKAQCVRCGGSLLVPCVFCGQTSPCTATACVACHEPFAGAADRKRSRDAQQTLQTVASVVSMFVGGGAAAAASAPSSISFGGGGKAPSPTYDGGGGGGGDYGNPPPMPSY